MQSLPLEAKILKTKMRIREWYDFWDGDVYVSFSGGKDSTVLLHIVRELYSDIPAVFVDTGLEYPEIREFVKTINNIIWLKPEMNFKEVIKTYGYPVISKRQAQSIREARNTKSETLYTLRMTGIRKNGEYSSYSKISEKYKYLVTAPFKISDQCCNIMKKKPMKKYVKETGRYSINGVMASESNNRKITYLKQGCNAFNLKIPISSPIGFWTEQDVLQYIKEFNIPYSSIYGDIIEIDGKLTTTGEKRTGCMFCMFGVHLEDEPNRFQRMQITHPKIYDYCINKLGCGKVLDYINIPY